VKSGAISPSCNPITAILPSTARPIDRAAEHYTGLHRFDQVLLDRI
jgi:hypothetical protein